MERTKGGAELSVAGVDFLKVTERAAIESARWLGRGDNNSADQAAVDAMRAELGAMPITGTVVIGEGQKDEAPELYVGEVLGRGGMECDHLYVGMGGSTEGVITAAALECLGAEIQAKMWPRHDADLAKMAQFGMEGPADRVYSTRDLAPAPLYVIATGVTDGNLLQGVRYFADGARTHSIVMDLVGNTVRFIDTVHLFSSTIISEIRL